LSCTCNIRYLYLLYGSADAEEPLAPERPPIIPIFPKRKLHHIVAHGEKTAIEKLSIIPMLCHSCGHMPCTVGHEIGMLSTEMCPIDRTKFAGYELRLSHAAQSTYMFTVEKAPTTQPQLSAYLRL
jgi:hypothetical protein